MLTTEEFNLMSIILQNPKAPVEDSPVYNSLKKQQLIRKYIDGSNKDGSFTYAHKIVNPEGKRKYEEYMREIKVQSLSDRQTILNEKSYKLDVWALIISIAAIVISIITLFIK